jgi:hypothetical protein
VPSNSGNIQATFRQYSGNIQARFRQHSGNIQATFRQYPAEAQADTIRPEDRINMSAQIVINMSRATFCPATCFRYGKTIEVSVCSS